jgi:hypothetical protein
MSETVINTIEGTFIVPAEKQQELLMWLKTYAIKAGQQPIREYSNNIDSSYVGRTLINE